MHRTQQAPCLFCESHQNTDGRTKIANGYRYVYAPRHIASDASFFVPEHRLVMERYLGRFLYDNEEVHHIDGDGTNNDLENLVLCQSHSEHMKHHRSKKRRDPEIIDMVRKAADDQNAKIDDIDGVSAFLVRKICRDNGIHWKNASICHATDEDVIEAMKITKNVEELASMCGMSKTTMYRKHGHLLNKRKPPGFLDQHREDVCRKLLTSSAHAVAQEYDTTATTIRHALRKWSEAGVLPIELAEHVNRDGRRKHKL